MNCGYVLAALALIAAWTTPAVAQNQEARPNPTVVVRKDFGAEPEALGDRLPIRKMDVAVDILGNTSSTVVTVTFAHVGGPPVEADFSLDLPQGAVITSYALDVDGHLVDGVLVDQRTGKKAYENTVRRGVDPGLAEVTRTGGFHTRVFPVTANAPRTIRLSFVAPVTDGAYRLPLVGVDPVQALDVRLSVRHQTATPSVRAPAGLDLRVDSAGNAQGSARNIVLKDVLEVTGLVAALASVTEHAAERFFDVAVSLTPQDGGAAPRPLTIFWDASLSRKDDDLDREKTLLSAYLAQARPYAIDLVVFSDGAPNRLAFSAADAPGAVIAALHAVRYQGATSFAAVSKERQARPTTGDCLLFSDGDVTIDDYDIDGWGCPLFVISTAPDARTDVLGVLARKSGGDAFNLDSADVETVVARMTSGADRVVSVTGEDGRPIDFLALTGQGGARVLGPAPATGGLIVQTRRGVQRIALPTSAPSHPGAASLWARARLADSVPLRARRTPPRSPSRAATRSRAPALSSSCSRRLRTMPETASSRRHRRDRTCWPPTANTWPRKSRKTRKRSPNASETWSGLGTRRRRGGSIRPVRPSKACRKGVTCRWRHPRPRPRLPSKCGFPRRPVYRPCQCSKPRPSRDRRRAPWTASWPMTSAPSRIAI